MSPKPKDKELYADIKKKAKKKFKVYPSIYANSWLVSEYKKAYAKKYGEGKEAYTGKKPTDSGIPSASTGIQAGLHFKQGFPTVIQLIDYELFAMNIYIYIYIIAWTIKTLRSPGQLSPLMFFLLRGFFSIVFIA